MEIKQGYHPQFDIDLKFGQECERLTARMLLGFHEVKGDRMALTTGNLFVEYECRNKASGIATSKADWWTFHLHDDLYVVVKADVLRRLEHDRKIRRVSGGEEKASLGYLLPLKWLFRRDSLVRGHPPGKDLTVKKKKK